MGGEIPPNMRPPTPIPKKKNQYNPCKRVREAIRKRMVETENEDTANVQNGQSEDQPIPPVSDINNIRERK